MNGNKCIFNPSDDIRTECEMLGVEFINDWLHLKLKDSSGEFFIVIPTPENIEPVT